MKRFGAATCCYLLLLAAKDRAKEAASFSHGRSSAAFQEPAAIQLLLFFLFCLAAAKRLNQFLLVAIFESQSDLLSQPVACQRELAAASEGPVLRMGHLSSGSSLSLAF